jgi:hypothetical protein
MKETTDHLENIVDILHASRKKNKKIGARLKHFYGSKEKIKVQLTGKGWVIIDTVWAEKGVSGMTPEEIMAVVDSFKLSEK